MAETISNNIPVLSVGKTRDMLVTLYEAALVKKTALNRIPSVMLWAPPGVGKSDMVRELAKELEERTGKNVHVTDVRLLLFSPVDLRGIPVPDEKKQFANWLMPKIFHLPSGENDLNILFLDELSAAPQAVQAAAYQLTLDRRVGEHPLPDNTIIICAGNRTTDRSVAYRMPNALANRLMHFEIQWEFESWREWAVQEKIHPYVLGYLSFDPKKLYCEENGLDDVAFATPRSWSFVSDLLNTLPEEKNIDTYYPLIAACVGAGAALTFIGWVETHNDLPDCAAVLAGCETTYPKTTDALYALVGALTSKVVDLEKSEPGGILKLELENLCEYVNRMPPDFAALLYRNISTIRTLLLKLVTIPAFRNWKKAHPYCGIKEY